MKQRKGGAPKLKKWLHVSCRAVEQPKGYTAAEARFSEPKPRRAG
jgi:hypothetical protein